MISRSTTPDLIKMVSKLDEFFTQQFTSSKRALSAFGPIRAKRMMSADHEGILYFNVISHKHYGMYTL
jgi:hypothetical protein